MSGCMSLALERARQRVRDGEFACRVYRDQPPAFARCEKQLLEAHTELTRLEALAAVQEQRWAMRGCFICQRRFILSEPDLCEFEVCPGCRARVTGPQPVRIHP